MNKPEPPAEARKGGAMLPIIFTVTVATLALIGLFVFEEEPIGTARPGPVAAMTTLPAPGVTAGLDEDGVRTMSGLPGFGVYDGAAFSDRAKALAEEQSTAALLAALQTVPPEPTNGAHADFAAALAIQQERGEGDRHQILNTMEALSRHRDAPLRRQALWALARNGDDGLAAMARALEELGGVDANPRAQQDLIAAISLIGPEASRAVDLLSNRLRHSADPGVQQSAAEALATMGPEARGTLLQVQRDLQTSELTRSQNEGLLKRLDSIVKQLDQIEGFER